MKPVPNGPCEPPHERAERVRRVSATKGTTMHNTTTHYQMSFRVSDADGDGMKRVKAAVYGWVAKKEPNRLVRQDKSEFSSLADPVKSEGAWIEAIFDIIAKASAEKGTN